MNKRILSLALVGAIIMGGCSDKTEKTPEELNPIFFTYNACYYGNGVVYGDEPVVFLDFDTMEKAPLCAVPNCSHTISSCLAQMVGNTPIFYNDYVYYFTSNGGDVKETPDGRDFFIDSKLWRASLDSSETEVVCEFTDCAPEEGYPDYVLYGNELYFTADDLNPTEGLDGRGVGGWGTSGGYHFLCSINLDTGEYTNHGSIYDGDKQYDGAAYSSGADITGIYNDTMYLTYSFIKDNDVIQNTDHGLPAFTCLYFEFDFETKTWKESTLQSGDMIYYMSNDAYYYKDFDAKETHIVHPNGEIVLDVGEEAMSYGGTAHNGKFFFSAEGVWYDLSDGSEHSMGEYKEYDVVGYHDGCYILAKGGRTAKITEEELLALE